MTDVPALPPGFELMPEQSEEPPLPAGFVPVDDSAPAAAPQPVAEPNDAGVLNAIPFGVAQALTLNTSDEIEAGLRTGFGLSGDYEEALAETRANMEKARAKHPWLFLGGEIAGGLAGGAGLVKGGLSLTGRAASAGKGILTRGAAASAEGAAYGAAYGAGGGTTPEERLTGAERGAVAGAVLGPIAEGTGSLIARAIPGQSTRAVNRLPASAREGVQAAEEFGIPLTRGQATGDIPSQAFEEAGRHGAKGPLAERILNNQAKVADEAVENARQAIQTDLGGEAVDSVYEAGERTVEGLRARATQLKTDAQKAYDAADAAGVEIAADAVRDVPNFLRSALDAEDVVVDPTLHPAATIALKRADDFITKMQSTDGDVLAVSLQGLDQLRRVLNANRGAPGSDDARVVRQIKTAYDGWVERAVDGALFSGDEAGLTALKKARGLWSQYKSLTSAQTGDDAGGVIAKMVKMDVDPVEATNWLLGVAKTGASGRAVRVVKRLKQELGANSEPMQTLRQSMWLKLTQNPEGKIQPGPQAVSQAIKEFVSGKGSAMARQMFTSPELSKMRRYARALDALVPNPKSTNPSKSGFRAMDAMRSVASDMAGMIGLASGGVDAGLAAKFGLPLFTGTKNAARARQFTGVPVPVVNQLPGAVAVGAIGGDELTP